MENFIIPEIPVKKIERNVFHEKLLREIESWVSQYANIEWKDSEDWVEILSIAYANVTDYEKVLLVAKWTMAGFTNDDKIDFSPNYIQQFIEFFQENKFECLQLEDKRSFEYLLWKEVYNEFKQRVSPSFYQLIVNETFNFVNACAKLSKIKKNSTYMTVQQLLELREYDSGCYLFIVFTMFVFGVNESILEIEAVREFHEQCVYHLVFVNELYSFNNEYRNNTIDYNYINLLSKEKNIGLNESIILVVEQIKETESNIRSIRDKIINNYPEVSDEYLDGMIDLCLGCLVWSKICRRYGNLGYVKS